MEERASVIDEIKRGLVGHDEIHREIDWQEDGAQSLGSGSEMLEVGRWVVSYFWECTGQELYADAGSYTRAPESEVRTSPIEISELMITDETGADLAISDRDRVSLATAIRRIMNVS